MAECGRCTNQTRCFLPTQESILVPSVINKFRKEFEPGFDTSGFNRQFDVPKIESYDEQAGKFVYEKYPIEFQDTALALHR
jgi:hypothetical protein